MIRSWLARSANEDSVFLYLLGYSWVALVPPALALALNRPSGTLPLLVFGAALAHNLLLSAFHPALNRLVQRNPIYFTFDLFLAGLFIAGTGGTNSPYYLFALAPILAAAFFYQMRGGLIAAAALACLYLAAIVTALGVFSAPIDFLQAFTQIVSFFLIAVLFGYPAVLLERIQHASSELSKAHGELVQKNSTLERTNRELESIHSLGLAMQSSSIDVFDVQERILTTITGDLEFERAMLALVDPDSNVLMGWVTHRRSRWYDSPDGLFHTCEIPLRPEDGLLARVILDGKPCYFQGAVPLTNDAAVNSRLGLESCAILPLIMRDHPVGVIVVDNPDTRAPINAESLMSLGAVANQAALALGSTKLCIERAQRLAVEEERNRIAMEIHDTASQSLFGIVYALDACLKMLSGDTGEVRQRLADTRSIAQRTMIDLRRSVYDIWVGELGGEEFASELRSHLVKLDAPSSLQVEIDVGGEIKVLPTFARRNLLRIAEEALANVVKHSNATITSVRLVVQPDHALLSITDNGRGIERANGRSSGFGLKSIQERARAIGAEAKLSSPAGTGTRLELVVPLPFGGRGTAQVEGALPSAGEAEARQQARRFE